MKPVLLMTVMRDNGTEPIAHGIYENAVQMLAGLQKVGINPGFDCVQKPLFNQDGSPAGLLFASGQYVATASMMPLSVAAAIVNGAPAWDVPDTAEGIVDARQ